MELKEGMVYQGFLLKESHWIEDIKSHAYIFLHEQSGGRLLYIKNSDVNKVFSVSFATPPTDHTGVAHILEHSVLCGSKKYEAKDPFNELAKGSLNTYLNAMTFSDKTMYPVASCNEEDFHNLVDVYLDAVFYPNIYKKKEIFMQEGWRYFFDDDGQLAITGVVYNEMQGALSDPESLLSSEIAEVFYGDTTYGFESGGLPSDIPHLTYEQFLDFHKTHYHPSNGYFFLYGDLDLDRALAHISEGYLDQFHKQSLENIQIILPKTYPSAPFLEATYPAQTDDEDEKGYLAYTFPVGKNSDLVRTMALQILSYCLLETNASPLKKKLIEKGLCEEVEGWFDSAELDMLFTIVGKNANTEEANQFQAVIDETLKEIVAEGLEDDLVRTSLKRVEFLLKEDDFGSTPRGLVYNIRAMKSWLHGESPIIHLQQLQALEVLKSEEFSWEDLILELFINATSKNLIVFLPDHEKEERENEAYNKKLAEKQADLSADEVEAIKNDMEMLEIFQTTEESQEILDQIPFLKLGQISKKPMLVKREVGTFGFGKEIFVPVDSKDIIYLKLHFSTKGMPKHLLPYCGLVTEILGRLDTTNYLYEFLPMLANEVVGALSFNNSIFARSVTEYDSFVTLKSKFLIADQGNAKDLFQDILLNTQFTRIDNLKKILQSTKINNENHMMNAPHILAIEYGNRSTSVAGALQEQFRGYTYVNFVNEVCKVFDDTPMVVVERLEETMKHLICKENFSVSYACEEKARAEVRKFIERMYHHLPSRTLPVDTTDIVVDNSTPTAFSAPMQVQYNVLMGQFADQNIEYSGQIEVLKTILDLEYLWNEVRVQGGAYGAGCSFKRIGSCFFYSYRDPNIEKTYEVYRNLWKSIAEFEATDKELTKYILGTINRFDQPRSNSDLLLQAVFAEYTGLSDEQIQRERLEILGTTVAELRGFVPLLQAVAKSQNMTTVGNTAKVEEKKELFSEVKKLLS